MQRCPPPFNKRATNGSIFGTTFREASLKRNLLMRMAVSLFSRMVFPGMDLRYFLNSLSFFHLSRKHSLVILIECNGKVMNRSRRLTSGPFVFPSYPIRSTDSSIPPLKIGACPHVDCQGCCEPFCEMRSEVLDTYLPFREFFPSFTSISHSLIFGLSYLGGSGC